MKESSQGWITQEYSMEGEQFVDCSERLEFAEFSHKKRRLILTWGEQVQSGQSLSHVRLFVTPWTTARTSPTPGAYSNSCPWSWWCHPTISSSVVHFSSHLQSFPALRSFPKSQFFVSGGQSIGVSASASEYNMGSERKVGTIQFMQGPPYRTLMLL